jgi:catechol 2,3-dioxygenase-like lactoylglutathione lyase family enzyme
LDDTLAMLKEQGIPILSGPFLHPTMRFVFIGDPNGLKIELKQPL